MTEEREPHEDRPPRKEELPPDVDSGGGPDIDDGSEEPWDPREQEIRNREEPDEPE